MGSRGGRGKPAPSSDVVGFAGLHNGVQAAHLLSPARSDSDIDSEDESQSEELKKLFVFGYAAKVFQDDETAAAVDHGKFLMQCMSDGDLLVDRHDGRHSLTDLKGIKAVKKNPPTVKLDAKQLAEEKKCEEERWRDLRRAEIRRQREAARREAGLAAAGTARDLSWNYENEGEQDNEVAAPPPSPGPTARSLLTEESSFDLENEPLSYTLPFTINQPVALPLSLGVHEVIVHTARFLTANSVQVGIALKASQKGNPLLAFLDPSHTLHPYFELVHQRVKNNLPVDVDEGVEGAAEPVISLVGYADSDTDDESPSETQGLANTGGESGTRGPSTTQPSVSGAVESSQANVLPQVLSPTAQPIQPSTPAELIPTNPSESVTTQPSAAHLESKQQESPFGALLAAARDKSRGGMGIRFAPALINPAVLSKESEVAPPTACSSTESASAPPTSQPPDEPLISIEPLESTPSAYPATSPEFDRKPLALSQPSEPAETQSFETPGTASQSSESAEAASPSLPAASTHISEAGVDSPLSAEQPAHSTMELSTGLLDTTVELHTPHHSLGIRGALDSAAAMDIDQDVSELAAKSQVSELGPQTVENQPETHPSEPAFVSHSSQCPAHSLGSETAVKGSAVTVPGSAMLHAPIFAHFTIFPGRNMRALIDRTAREVAKRVDGRASELRLSGTTDPHYRFALPWNPLNRYYVQMVAWFQGNLQAVEELEASGRELLYEGSVPVGYALWKSDAADSGNGVHTASRGHDNVSVMATGSSSTDAPPGESAAAMAQELARQRLQQLMSGNLQVSFGAKGTEDEASAPQQPKAKKPKPPKANAASTVLNRKPSLVKKQESQESVANDADPPNPNPAEEVTAKRAAEMLVKLEQNRSGRRRSRSTPKTRSRRDSFTKSRSRSRSRSPSRRRSRRSYSRSPSKRNRSRSRSRSRGGYRRSDYSRSPTPKRRRSSRKDKKKSKKKKHRSKRARSSSGSDSEPGGRSSKAHKAGSGSESDAGKGNNEDLEEGEIE